MNINYEEIDKKWNEIEPLYSNLGKEAQKLLKELIYEGEMYAEVTGRTKDIISIFKKLKKKNEGEPYSFDDLTDRLGLRIICNYKEDMILIDSIIRNNFDVKKFEDKAKDVAPDKLAYTSYHYDLTYPNSVDPKLKELVFELQLRTINQHTWACTAHELSYKQEIELPHELKRKVHRLLALYEIADDELSSVNSFIYSHEDFSLFALFKKLEKKFYKLAKCSFDKEQTLEILKITMSFLSDKENKSAMDSVSDFADSNAEKISHIFSDYSAYSYYNFILLQPETILIWYLLENFEYSVTDNWGRYFDTDDLELIKSAWGIVE